MKRWQYTRGLHEIGAGIHAWLLPDGGWCWSNAGLIVDGDATLLVDTLFDLHLTGEMLGAMRDAVPTARRIDKLVNTHANADHTWGNQLVRGAEIIASQGCVEEFAHFTPDFFLEMMGRTAESGVLGEFLEHCFSPFDVRGVVLTPPTTVFADEKTLKVGDKTVHLYNVGPAHTRGDTLVHVPDDRMVFTGDILFVGGHPVIWDGPIDNWRRACDRLLAMDVDVVVPGHGPISDKSAVRRFRGYLDEIEHETRKRYDAGMDELAAAKDIALAAFDDWNDAERVFANVAALYREFRGQAPDEGLAPMEVFAGMAELYKYQQAGKRRHGHRH
jgi:glyoxylase-like metal-dependent hydrolase (beta-lactamase superfamily II)